MHRGIQAGIQDISACSEYLDTCERNEESPLHFPPYTLLKCGLSKCLLDPNLIRMVPATNESYGYPEATKSFSGPPVFTPTNPDSYDGLGRGNKEKILRKRSSGFHFGSSMTSILGAADDEFLGPSNSERPSSPQSRPRTSQKGKPSTLFGSFGKKSGNLLRDKSHDSLDITTEPSTFESGQGSEQINGSRGKRVIHHGEVQTTSGLFRKKKEYLVLTETHLTRYKSQSRASEVFPSIQSSIRRSSSTRHPSTASIGSLQDLQSLTSHTSSEGENSIPLKQIVAAYKVEDGRPFFTTEVVYLDEENNLAGSIQLMLNDPKEADLWYTSIRGAAQKARLISSQPYPERVVLFLVNVVEAALDYHEAHFTVFRVVRRATTKPGGRSSSDDYAKLGTSVSYMVIGINRLHLISLPDFSEPSQFVMDAKASKTMFGLVSLVSMVVQHAEDAFQLGFRSVPSRQKLVSPLIQLSSSILN